MKGMVDPNDKIVTNILCQIERFGFNARHMNDITEPIRELARQVEVLTPKQRENFMATLLFNYAGYYYENFKAREKAEYCKRYHNSNR